MVGHYLSGLSDRQEHRVLTRTLRPGKFTYHDGSGCLRGIAEGFFDMQGGGWGTIDKVDGMTFWDTKGTYWGLPMLSITAQYDMLCKRFGEARVNTAIRNRILTNRLWRTMSQRAEVVYGAIPEYV